MRKLLIFFVITCAGLFLSACSSPVAIEGERIEANILLVNEDGITKIDVSQVNKSIKNALNGDLSDQEKKDVLYLREQEKLKRDLLLMLFEEWGLKSLNNISHSESSHTAAVKELIVKYKMVDPSTPENIGKFQDKGIIDLYEKFLEKGRKSKEKALRTAAEIEEINLEDLAKFKSRTNKPDLVFVYENLEKATRNHIRNLVKNLEEIGYTYTGERLGGKRFKDIINSPIERGVE